MPQPTPRLLGDLSLPPERSAGDIAGWALRIGARLGMLFIMTALALVVVFILSLGLEHFYSEFSPK